MNWSWPALKAVMQGREPRESFKVEAINSGRGLYDIQLVNTGEITGPDNLYVAVTWHSGKILAADALGAFRIAKTEKGKVVLKHVHKPRFRQLKPTEKGPVGWIKFNRET